MPARLQRWNGAPPGEDDLDARLRAEGLEPHRWSNGPGDSYSWHSHGYSKVLYCLSGAITFHLRDEDDIVLGPGDRLEVDPGTEHAATVGPEGVQCAEAAR